MGGLNFPQLSHRLIFIAITIAYFLRLSNGNFTEELEAFLAIYLGVKYWAVPCFIPSEGRDELNLSLDSAILRGIRI